MKICLISPPQVITQTQVGAGVMPPLGIAYLASYLLAHGHGVELVDALGEQPDHLTPFKRGTMLRGMGFAAVAARVPADARVIGISNLFSVAYPVVEALLDTLHAYHPDKILVLGGPHPSAFFKQILETRPEVSYVATGMEGEDSLLRLVEYVSGDAPFETLSGMATRDAEGRVVKLQSTQRIRSIDRATIPFPARHLLPMENYITSRESHGASQGRWTSILSSRGCPYGCTFCESRRTQWIGRSPVDVVDEIEQCIKNWNIEEFHFEDDNMTLANDRLLQICDEIIRRGLKIRWQTPNGIRASRTTRQMLARMKESGCMHVTLAPETGSERVLVEIIQKGRDFTLEQLKECGANAKAVGLKVAAYFILGLPGETREDVDATVRYGRELAKIGVDEASFATFAPLPGTPLWDVVKDQVEGIDWLDFLSVGDLGWVKSWNPLMSDDELYVARRDAYVTFHTTRMVYQPAAFLRSLFNVIRDVQETKTERALQQILGRFRGRRKKQSDRTLLEGLNAYPYSAARTLKVLFEQESVYAYRHSLLKALRLIWQDFRVRDRKVRPSAQ